MDTIVSGLGGVHGGSRATCQLGRARGQASAAARAAVRRVAGLGHRIETLELGLLHRAIFKGNFEVAADFHCSYIVEPDLALFKFQSMDVNPINYSRYVDRTLDDLYQKQSRAADREERRRYIREFERRLLDEEAHYIYTLQWHRIVVHSARVRGWTITPSHFLNNQLDTVWLAEP